MSTYSKGKIRKTITFVSFSAEDGEVSFFTFLVILSFTRATELRNALLYVLLPLIVEHLSNNVAAHLALFVCALRVRNC